MLALSKFRAKADANPSRRLEVELSTQCVARCLACPRTRALSGESRDEGWQSGYLPPETLFRLLRNAPEIDEIGFCGSYGDAIYHPGLHEIMRGLQRFPRLKVSLETNGSHRKPEWWTELGQLMLNHYTVIFSLDGLEDTNGIYRRNTDWSSILAGIKALRSAFQGRIQWKWIVFRHNQHQVVEGARLAQSLGVDSFKLVDSRRHFNGSQPTLPIAQLEAQVESVARQAAMSL